MYCFIRPGELLRLRVQDIDFENNQICVSRTISKNDIKAFAQIPKAIQAKVFEWWGDCSPGDYLFRLPNENKPVDAKFFPLRHQTLIGKMGYDLSIYKPYSWKHTGATMYIRNGGRAKSLQLLMRHHSLQMTDEYLKSLGINDMDDSDDVMPSL
jgi:integrase